MTSTTEPSSTTTRPEPFSEADRTWELERLYRDLAKVKGKPLGVMEKRYLRGLLCGYGPTELAQVVCRQPATLTSYLSRTVYQYVKELTGHEDLLNYNQIAGWLEKYKKSPKDLRSLLESTKPGEVLAIKSVTIEGVFNIQNCNVFIDSQNNLKIIPAPDQVHLTPERSKGGGEGKK